jgi:hypothetical protein
MLVFLTRRHSDIEVQHLIRIALDEAMTMIIDVDRCQIIHEFLMMIDEMLTKLSSFDLKLRFEMRIND